MQNPRDWLTSKALPLWSVQGIDSKHRFVEALSQSLQPLALDRRALVQARQLYSFRGALERKWIPEAETSALKEKLDLAAQRMIQDFAQGSGAFAHSVDMEGKISNPSLELYTQAFALFGLAQAYGLHAKDLYRDQALKLLQYLQTERRASRGGFVEIKKAQRLFESNPHMHLFEAMLAWMEVDPSPSHHEESPWRTCADEVLELCLTKFIDPRTACLAENFDESWTPLRKNNVFIVEPGHLFEWSWLMGRYQRITGKDLSSVRNSLFSIGEKAGICAQRQVVFDEIWSDLSPKTKTARFWPQCERIKCATQVGDQAAARQAMKVLLRYFETPIQGLWWDRMAEDGQFIDEPAKASSLYHIFGAISEAEGFL